jgi:hypothetical protein
MGVLKTEKVTLVPEGFGDGKIRCRAGAWSDAKVILEDQDSVCDGSTNAGRHRLRLVRCLSYG